MLNRDRIGTEIGDGLSRRPEKQTYNERCAVDTNSAEMPRGPGKGERGCAKTLPRAKLTATNNYCLLGKASQQDGSPSQ